MTGWSDGTHGDKGGNLKSRLNTLQVVVRVGGEVGDLLDVLDDIGLGGVDGVNCGQRGGEEGGKLELHGCGWDLVSRREVCLRL